MHCGLVRYIAAQIFGGYIACLLVYAQYKDLINVSENSIALPDATLTRVQSWWTKD